MRVHAEESIHHGNPVTRQRRPPGATVPGMQIEIFLFDGFDELDAFDPSQVRWRTSTTPPS